MTKGFVTVIIHRHHKPSDLKFRMCISTVRECKLIHSFSGGIKVVVNTWLSRHNVLQPCKFAVLPGSSKK
jgi:hypothetical protein